MAKQPIKINPANKGKFTAKAKLKGEGVQQFAEDVLKPGSKATPAIKKQAVFAKNAAKWKKK